MLPEYKNKTNIGVGVGFIFFIWGCSSYAQGKGYSQWIGALGLLSIFGLVVLAVLPDKHK
jgi:hypothetical protein